MVPGATLPTGQIEPPGGLVVGIFLLLPTRASLFHFPFKEFHVGLVPITQTETAMECHFFLQGSAMLPVQN